MFHNNSRTWNNVNAQQDEVATDIHWSIEATYDFYLNKMGRNSVDNKGRMLVGMGHFGKKFNNAFWNGSFAAFGDGDSVHMYPLASLDICAHEISHGVTQETAGLLYDNEPGALNESYSDILGKCVEHYSLPATFSWQIGAQILCGKKPMRDMQDPQAALQPKFYGGAFYYKGKDDNGGVHINGGVQNYWFYLLCEGGSGFRESDAALFTVKPIGWDKAAMLVYNTLTNYMTVSSGYADAAYYSMTAAKALFGAGSEEARQVQMAWYAVGLADKPLSTGIDDVSLSSFSVYPNPVSGNSLRLSFDHPVSGSVLRLSDMSGKVLLQKENPIAGSDLDISALSNGIYLLELSSGAAISRTKIIKY
jgi:Zn-dependent metalloprotease